MHRASALIPASLFLLVLSLPALAGGLPNGLYLESFRIIAPSPAQVGDTVAVEFTLVNGGSRDITFSSEFGVFVGCRWNSTSDANNRDFGHEFKGFVLGPGRPLHIHAERVLDQAGTWRFWPAFNVGGQWGPFRWEERTLEVAAAPGSSGGGMGVDVVVFPSGVLDHPGMYDGNRMMFEGIVVVVDTLVVEGATYYLAMLADPRMPDAILPVLCDLSAGPVFGERMRFTGKFVGHAQWGCLTASPGVDARGGPAVRVTDTGVR